VSEAQIGTVQPLLLLVWIELSGIVLLTFGLSARHSSVVEQPKRRRGRKKRRLPRTPPTSSAAMRRHSAKPRLVSSN
jgi:hypothetical protein